MLAAAANTPDVLQLAVVLGVIAAFVSKAEDLIQFVRDQDYPSLVRQLRAWAIGAVTIVTAGAHGAQNAVLVDFLPKLSDQVLSVKAAIGVGVASLASLLHDAIKRRHA